jgi:hypothetical protein
VDGLAQPIALATGRSPLAIVNPQAASALQWRDRDGGARLIHGPATCDTSANKG